MTTTTCASASWWKNNNHQYKLEVRISIDASWSKMQQQPQPSTRSRPAWTLWECLMQRSNATCIRAHHLTSGCSHAGRRMFVQVETRSEAPFLKSILRAMFSSVCWHLSNLSIHNVLHSSFALLMPCFHSSCVAKGLLGGSHWQCWWDQYQSFTLHFMQPLKISGVAFLQREEILSSREITANLWQNKCLCTYTLLLLCQY